MSLNGGCHTLDVYCGYIAAGNIGGDRNRSGFGWAMDMNPLRLWQEVAESYWYLKRSVRLLMQANVAAAAEFHQKPVAWIVDDIIHKPSSITSPWNSSVSVYMPSVVIGNGCGYSSWSGFIVLWLLRILQLISALLLQEEQSKHLPVDTPRPLVSAHAKHSAASQSCSFVRLYILLFAAFHT